MPARPRRPDEYASSSSPTVRAQGMFNDTGIVPEGYTNIGGNILDESSGYGNFINNYGWPLMLGIPGGVAAGMALAGGAGAAGGAGGASSSLPFASTVDTGLIPSLSSSTLAGTSGAGAGASMASGGGFFSKLFGSRGLDPTALLLGGLSMFGGDDSEDMQSFSGKGTADPVAALQKALSLIDTLGASLQKRPGANLRSSQLAPPPAPVSIPGIPFQIGGGLGTDPALRDSMLLQGQPTAQAGFGSTAPQGGSSTPSRRKPGGGR